MATTLPAGDPGLSQNAGQAQLQWQNRPQRTVQFTGLDDATAAAGNAANPNAAPPPAPAQQETAAPHNDDREPRESQSSLGEIGGMSKSEWDFLRDRNMRLPTGQWARAAYPYDEYGRPKQQTSQPAGGQPQATGQGMGGGLGGAMNAFGQAFSGLRSVFAGNNAPTPAPQPAPALAPQQPSMQPPPAPGGADLDPNRFAKRYFNDREARGLT